MEVVVCVIGGSLYAGLGLSLSVHSVLEENAHVHTFLA